MTVDVGTNPVPVMVIFSAPAPIKAVAGATDVIAGTGLITVTVESAALELLETEPFATVTTSVAPGRITEAGMVAWS